MVALNLEEFLKTDQIQNSTCPCLIDSCILHSEMIAFEVQYILIELDYIDWGVIFQGCAFLQQTEDGWQIRNFLLLQNCRW